MIRGTRTWIGQLYVAMLGHISSRVVYRRRAVQIVVYDAWRAQIACLMETYAFGG
jgi:hypothetical protein